MSSTCIRRRCATGCEPPSSDDRRSRRARPTGPSAGVRRIDRARSIRIASGTSRSCGASPPAADRKPALAAWRAIDPSRRRLADPGVAREEQQVAATPGDLLEPALREPKELVATHEDRAHDRSDARHGASLGADPGPASVERRRNAVQRHACGHAALAATQSRFRIVATSASLPAGSASVHHIGANSSRTSVPPAAIAAATRASACSCGTQTATWIAPPPSAAARPSARTRTPGPASAGRPGPRRGCRGGARSRGRPARRA